MTRKDLGIILLESLTLSKAWFLTASVQLDQFIFTDYSKRYFYNFFLKQNSVATSGSGSLSCTF